MTSTCDPHNGVQPHGWVGGYLTHINPRIPALGILRAEPPVVGVGEGGGDPGVGGVGGVPHGQQVRHSTLRGVAQPGDLSTKEGDSCVQSQDLEGLKNPTNSGF